ncbi:MAG TPA: SDR family NAD(P)-dependent oxidoreductase, partial [Nitrososphaera sp.]|nr:SDR family NAD(P)-dependent oxidoreductase [Nitrososphaera sp.]
MLKGKVAVITGASGGIGFEMAREFAARGATVIVCSRRTASAEKSASLIRGKAYPERLDVTDPAAVAKFMRHVAERHRRVDILVNNAGYPFDHKTWTKRFHEVSEEEFDRVI